MKPIRVALSGSGFRLSAHLGALWAIVEAGYTIVELAGTSGGSIVAALYASGMNLKDMHKLCMSLDWSPMMRFSPWSMVMGKGLCSGDALQRFLLQVTRGKTFAELDVEFKAIAADLLTEKEFQFSRERTPDVPIAVAARASASIPIVFPPVECAGAVLVDGGTCDNVPASDLTVDEVRRIGIYLVSDDEPLKPGRYSLRTLAPRIIDLMLSSNEAAHVALDMANGAEIVRVPTGYASSFDRNMPAALRQQLFDDGYAETARALTA
jgi:NTE family protein